jgi:hypothetical protein
VCRRPLVDVDELRSGFSNTARNPEGVRSHRNRNECVMHGSSSLGTCRASAYLPLHPLCCFDWEARRGGVFAFAPRLALCPHL